MVIEDVAVNRLILESQEVVALKLHAFSTHTTDLVAGSVGLPDILGL
jgi:hypothetical protein